MNERRVVRRLEQLVSTLSLASSALTIRARSSIKSVLAAPLVVRHGVLMPEMRCLTQARHPDLGT